jgi:hypothetical protein
VIAATVQATPKFLHRDTTVDTVVDLTARAATQGAGLPTANGNSSPVSTRRSTTPDWHPRQRG